MMLRIYVAFNLLVVVSVVVVLMMISTSSRVSAFMSPYFAGSDGFGPSHLRFSGRRGRVGTITTSSVNDYDNINIIFSSSEERRIFLDLTNHPLQLQLATGELPLGCFRRLVADRAVILEGLMKAASMGLMDEEMSRHSLESQRWLVEAEKAGKTISVPGIECYSCGGDHLNIDCPEDNIDAGSPSAQALRSVLSLGSVSDASAVLDAYGFACTRLLDAVDRCSRRDDGGDKSDSDDGILSNTYRGWLEAHAERWKKISCSCKEHEDNSSSSSNSMICLSMLYNWIDSEAATTGIRLLNDGTKSTSNSGGGGSAMEMLREAIEELEPGYAAQRNKHQSFVADITGKKDALARIEAAKRKTDAAAAYLAAKKKKEGTM